MQIHSIGIDLGKTTFHVVVLGPAGQVLVRRKFSQKQLLAYTANLVSSLVGLEACAGAHFLGRALRAQGHVKSPRASRACLAENWRVRAKTICLIWQTVPP